MGPTRRSILASSCTVLAVLGSITLSTASGPSVPMCSCPCPPAPKTNQFTLPLVHTGPRELIETQEDIVNYPLGDVAKGTYGYGEKGGEIIDPAPRVDCERIPNHIECEPKVAAPKGAKIMYKWVLSKNIGKECALPAGAPADSAAPVTDRLTAKGQGLCGSKLSVESTLAVCQKIAIEEGEVTVVDPAVDYARYIEVKGKKADDVTDEDADYVIQDGETFECTKETMPVSETPCGRRDCEVLKLVSTLSDCISLKRLSCGNGFQSKRNSCVSVGSGKQIPHEDWTGACLGQDGEKPETVVNLDANGEQLTCEMPNGMCEAGSLYIYTNYGACSDENLVELTCSADRADEVLYKLDGFRYRVATCKELDAAGDFITSGTADCSDITKEEVKMACSKRCVNKKLYEVPAWDEIDAVDTCKCTADDPGSLGLCEDNTLTKTKTRVLIDCNSASCTSPQNYITLPELTKTITEVCDPCKLSSGGDFCMNGGTCLASQGGASCACLEGFAGVRCNKKAGAVLQSDDGKVCVGVLNKGACCTSGNIDITGKCCDGDIDACGLCSEEDADIYRAGIDIEGACCESNNSEVYLTGDFTCCSTPDNVDDCGVCDGDNSSCKKQMDSSIDATNNDPTGFNSIMFRTFSPLGGSISYNGNTPLTARRRHLLVATDASYVLGSGAAITALDAGVTFVEAGEEAEADNVLASVPAFPETLPVPVAGNLVCEDLIGETIANSEGDCKEVMLCEMPSAVNGVLIGDPAKTCGGLGFCKTVTGECVCSPGYIGEACGVCDADNNYFDFEVGDLTLCTQIPTESPPVDATPPPPAVVEKDDGGLGIGVIVGIVVGVVVVIAIVAVVVYMLKFRTAKAVLQS